MTEQTTVENRDTGADATDDLRGHRREIAQRDIAQRRGLSEAGLVGTQVGFNVVRLRTDWQLTLHRLGALGAVVGLTGNEHATIESVAVYRNIATKGPAAQVSDGDTDLCLFLSEWRTGFARIEEGSLDTHRSLQFFDANGRAVHKVFLRENSDIDAFDELVDRQASENQKPAPEVKAEPRQHPPNPMRDIGERDQSLPVVHSIEIAQAQQIAGAMWSQRVALASVRSVLEAAILSKAPLLIMVGNHGAIQNHAGPIRGLREVDGWLSILDAKFNLHIHEPGIASAWLVRKGTPDGVVTSLELYDSGGEMIVYFARL